MTFTYIHVKWSVTLGYRLGPEILIVLEIKGQVLHRVHLHLKVPGWLSDLNAILTRKLPKFLPRLNERSGVIENICLVSGSLWSILKFLRMTFSDFFSMFQYPHFNSCHPRGVKSFHNRFSNENV